MGSHSGEEARDMSRHWERCPSRSSPQWCTSTIQSVWSTLWEWLRFRCVVTGDVTISDPGGMPSRSPSRSGCGRCIAADRGGRRRCRSRLANVWVTLCCLRRARLQHDALIRALPQPRGHLCTAEAVQILLSCAAVGGAAEFGVHASRTQAVPGTGDPCRATCRT